MVASGDRVRVNEAYKDRASLLNYAYSPADLTLQLESLRQNDTGFYRCEVQQGLEDADDVAQVKVKGKMINKCHKILQWTKNKVPTDSVFTFLEPTFLMIVFQACPVKFNQIPVQ